MLLVPMLTVLMVMMVVMVVMVLMADAAHRDTCSPQPSQCERAATPGSDGASAAP